MSFKPVIGHYREASLPTRGYYLMGVITDFLGITVSYVREGGDLGFNFTLGREYGQSANLKNGDMVVLYHNVDDVVESFAKKSGFPIESIVSAETNREALSFAFVDKTQDSIDFAVRIITSSFAKTKLTHRADIRFENKWNIGAIAEWLLSLVLAGGGQWPIYAGYYPENFFTSANKLETVRYRKKQPIFDILKDLALFAAEPDGIGPTAPIYWGVGPRWEHGGNVVYRLAYFGTPPQDVAITHTFTNRDYVSFEKIFTVSDILNSVTLQYYDRSLNLALSTVTKTNTASIAQYGTRHQDMSFPLFSYAHQTNDAEVIAQRLADADAWPGEIVTIKVEGLDMDASQQDDNGWPRPGIIHKGDPRFGVPSAHVVDIKDPSGLSSDRHVQGSLISSHYNIDRDGKVTMLLVLGNIQPRTSTTSAVLEVPGMEVDPVITEPVSNLVSALEEMTYRLIKTQRLEEPEE